MNNFAKYGLIAAVIAGVYFFSNSNDTNSVKDDIDLNLVLDVTVDTLHAYQEKLDGPGSDGQSPISQSNPDSQTNPDSHSSLLVTEATDPEEAAVKPESADTRDADAAFIGFAEALAVNYNKSQPAIYTGNIGVSPQTNASLVAFSDPNSNAEFDSDEEALFMIEIDGEKARIIASSRSGAVKDHSFSGTSLLAGYLIGSMLSRQRAAGVDPKSLSAKQPVTAGAAAKARAGSGSHSRGK